MSHDLEDAAEIYSFSLRHLMHIAVSDPVWGWFMVRLGIAQEGLLDALAPAPRTTSRSASTADASPSRTWGSRPR